MKAITTLFAFLLLFSFDFHAQTQGIAYPAVGKGVATTFVTDYHSLGINSSALGWGNEYDKKFTSGSTEFNLGFYSDSLSSDKLRKLYKAIRQNGSDNGADSTAWAEQRQNAIDYLNSGVTMDFNFNWLGFSFQSEKLGGFAINVSENYSWYSRLNENTTDLIFNGRVANYFDSLTVVFGTDTSQIANTGNLSTDTLAAVIAGNANNPLSLSQFMDGTEIRFAWNRHYNFGYGRKVFGDREKFALYAGIGGRFIQSMAMFNVEADGNNFYVYSSFNSNYDIDYGAIANSNPSNFLQSGNIPKPVGSGYGIDLSVSAIFFDKLKVAAAVNNIGSVTYTRNVYSVKDPDSLVVQMDLAGLGSANLTNSIYNLMEDGGIINLVGEEKYTLNNAATYRLGASIELGDRIRLGMDVVGPFNQDNPGSLQSPVFSFGGDIKPLKWLRLSMGYLGGGIYQHNMPVGVNFIFGGGTYECGISSRDFLSFFLTDSKSISSAFGFARVRF
jgi:hypothetical protein